MDLVGSPVIMEVKVSAALGSQAESSQASNCVWKSPICILLWVNLLVSLGFALIL